VLKFKKFFKKKDLHYKKLHNKWSKKHAGIKERLYSNHQKSVKWLVKNIPAKEHIAMGSLSGLLLLTPPVVASLPAQPASPSSNLLDEVKKIPSGTFFALELSPLLPDEVRPLSVDEEKKIGDVLSKHYNMKVSAELEGKKLNRSYGLIGAEQHLMRYPGDTMQSHFQTPEEEIFARSGMAPGRGAWGYFAPSFSEMTQKDVEREKYYIAVQTFLSPGFMDNVREHYAFYKYRKMLVVNPHNGRAVVVVIGDAGPAAWTGKHLGGSPEVMSHLQRVDGRARGPVLYFFIDDPKDDIPLGPIDVI